MKEKYNIEDARDWIRQYAEEMGQSLHNCAGLNEIEVRERTETSQNKVLDGIMKNGLDIGGITHTVRKVVGFVKVNGNLCFVLDGEKMVYPLYYYLRKEFIGSAAI